MKYQVCKPASNIMSATFSLTLIGLCSITSNAQMRKVNPALLKNYINPNTSVTVQTVANQKVGESKTTTVDNILVPDSGKTVVFYADRRIAKLDAASLQKYTSVTDGKLPGNDVKVLPEINVESLGGQGGTITYRVLFTMKHPLSYDAGSNSFTGKIGFLLMSDSDNTIPVKEPVKIEVWSDRAKSVVPDKLAIDHLSIPSTDVQVVADNVMDSISVRVGTVSNPEGYLAFLKVEPVLEISSNRESLQGLGIEETEIDVRLKGSKSEDSQKVVFSPQKGTVTPSSIYVKYNEPSTVMLRSQGLGDSKITAFSSTVNSNALLFQFKFPWAFLLAALIGGLLGAFVKYLPSDKTGKALTRTLIGGVLTGLIVAAAYYGLGISLIGIKLSALFNEIAVFALGALGAIFGIKLPHAES